MSSNQAVQKPAKDHFFLSLGFLASGVEAGLKTKGGKDVALVVNIGPKRSAGVVYTSNRSKANPILWSKAAFARSGKVDAILLNSGGANCFTGDFGFETSRLSAKTLADRLSLPLDHIQVCSTGLIGSGGEDFRQKLLEAVPRAVSSLSASGAKDAAWAILTTDTVAKTERLDFGSWSVAGMAKGAGMLAPGLATMLVVITTDAILEGSAQQALEEAVELSFNRIDSDGCMSTNDQVTLMLSGASETKVDYQEFTKALTQLCQSLARQLISDAEGADHDISIQVRGAKTEAQALEVARTVARNNLFKAAIFGKDANWGRVLAAIGTTKAEFDPYQVDLWMNGLRVCTKGGPDTPRHQVNLADREVLVIIDLFCGSETATILTNDLTYGYVEENSAYST